MYKKSMSISLQTYGQNGGYALFEIALAAYKNKILWFLLNKHWVLCDPTILGFQPGLYLGKNVRTPYSVWGINLNTSAAKPRRRLLATGIWFSPIRVPFGRFELKRDPCRRNKTDLRGSSKFNGCQSFIITASCICQTHPLDCLCCKPRISGNSVVDWKMTIP